MSAGVLLMRCENLYVRVGNGNMARRFCARFAIWTKTNSCPMGQEGSRNKQKNTRHNSYNCSQPPGHLILGGFSLRKNTGVNRMKKRIAVYGIIIAAISYGNAFGATTISRCCSGTTCSNSYIEGCKSCLTNLDCGGASGCTNCDSTDWAATGTAGYESKINAACMILTGQCTKTTEYRCAETYYGTSTDGKTGCTRCPSSKDGGLGDGDPYGNSDAGTTDITGCYIPAGDEICDATGCFDVIADCYYNK